MEGTVLKIRIIPPEGSNEFEELRGKKVTDGRMHGVAVYPKGTQQGGVSVGIFIEMPDGSFVHTETTSGLFEMAALAVKGAVEKYVGNVEVN